MSLSFLFIAVGCWLFGIAIGYFTAKRDWNAAATREALRAYAASDIARTKRLFESRTTLAGDLTSLIDECKRGS